MMVVSLATVRSRMVRGSGARSGPRPQGGEAGSGGWGLGLPPGFAEAPGLKRVEWLGLELATVEETSFLRLRKDFFQAAPAGSFSRRGVVSEFLGSRKVAG